MEFYLPLNALVFSLIEFCLRIFWQYLKFFHYLMTKLPYRFLLCLKEILKNGQQKLTIFYTYQRITAVPQANPPPIAPTMTT